MVEESSQSEKQPEQHKRANMPQQVQEQRLSPRPSFWPIVLALTLVVACIGVITHPILLGFGAALTVVVIIGWMREKH